MLKLSYEVILGGLIFFILRLSNVGGTPQLGLVDSLIFFCAEKFQND